MCNENIFNFKCAFGKICFIKNLHFDHVCNINMVQRKLNTIQRKLNTVQRKLNTIQRKLNTVQRKLNVKNQ